MSMRPAHRPAIALFVLCFGAYAYFYQAGGWNQNVRFDLVRSTVEQGSAVIDAYYRNTGDLSCRGPAGRCTSPAPARGDHAYCDKAPGASWLGTPAYALVHALAGRDRATPRYLAMASYLTTVWAVSLPSALAVVMLYMLLAAFGLSARARAAWAAAYGLATLAFPYATLFYGHQLMAALVLAGFALLVQARHRLMTDRAAGQAADEAAGQATEEAATAPDHRMALRLTAAGVLLGFAVAVEYPAALAVAPLCVYAACFVRPLSRLSWLIAGMAIPGLTLAAYHTIVFGGPATLPYEFSTQPHRGQGFFMGLGMPQGQALENILFTGYRGLLYAAPWLLAAVPGAVLLAQRPRFRAEAAVCIVIPLLFVWLNASLVDWQGGWAMGPRYLIPAIPFLVIAAAGTLLPGRPGTIVSGQPGARVRLPRAARIAFGAAAVAGAVYAFVLMLAGTAVKPEVPVHIRRPFGDYLLPRFFRGELAINAQSIDSIAPARTGEPAAWNLGQLMGLDGLASLIPLALLLAAAGTWLWHAAAQADRAAFTPGPDTGSGSSA